MPYKPSFKDHMVVSVEKETLTHHHMIGNSMRKKTKETVDKFLSGFYRQTGQQNG